MKKFYIETFGCQMNKSDSELMELSLAQAGFARSEKPEGSGILVYNTCSVREHAEKKAIAKIRSTKKKGQLVVVTGCMAQRLGSELRRKKIADIVIGPYESPSIGNIVREHLNKTSHKNEFLSLDRSDFMGRINTRLVSPNREAPWHRWVTITHGCENFCTYCIVPYVRGKLISFPSDQIIEYVKALAGSGISEISLLGQNVNQYGFDSDDIPFHSLLEKCAKVEGIDRINFITSHPKDFSDDTIRVISEHGNISRSIHLPLQSGSDRILKLMNRNYTVSHYMSIIEKFEKYLVPHSVSTDIIVGFPGESENDFTQTLAMLDRIRFDDAFMYAYSPREGTPAARMEETMTKEERTERLDILITHQRAISEQKMRSRIDQVDDAILERVSKRSPEYIMGRTFLNHPVVIPGVRDDLGKRIRIRIEGIRGSTLRGKRLA